LTRVVVLFINLITEFGDERDWGLWRS
jgi:hypothetical protein